MIKYVHELEKTFC